MLNYISYLTNLCLHTPVFKFAFLCTATLQYSRMRSTTGCWPLINFYQIDQGIKHKPIIITCLMQITKKDINYVDVTISKVTPQMKVRHSEALDDKVEYSVLKLTEHNFGKQSILFTRQISVHNFCNMAWVNICYSMARLIYATKTPAPFQGLLTHSIQWHRGIEAWVLVVVNNPYTTVTQKLCRLLLPCIIMGG